MLHFILLQKRQTKMFFQKYYIPTTFYFDDLKILCKVMKHILLQMRCYQLYASVTFSRNAQQKCCQNGFLLVIIKYSNIIKKIHAVTQRRQLKQYEMIFLELVLRLGWVPVSPVWSFPSLFSPRKVPVLVWYLVLRLKLGPVFVLGRFRGACVVFPPLFSPHRVPVLVWVLIY